MDNLENGMVLYSENEYEEEPICPICGEECGTIYLDDDRNVLGCSCCIRAKNAWEWYSEMKRVF